MDISEESWKKLEKIVEDEMLSTEEIRGSLEVTEKGRIRQSIQNCKHVLDHDPCLKGAICRNEMTCQIDIKKKVPWKRRGVQMTDTDMNNLSLYLEKNYGLTSDRVIIKAVDIVANNNSFHPIIDFLEGLTWDGTPRISHMLTHFFGAEDQKYTGEIMKMHMMAAISRLYEPGTKYDIMLCLVGGQGTGKSTFFKYLAIKDEWFTDDMKRLDDKKVYEYLQGHWIVEMSEMNAVANAKSIEEIKSFLSRQKETYKVPYETHPADRKRQCVFCGTSNTLDFLPLDRTGNRRFVLVMVHPELAEIHILDDEPAARAYLIQVWAEAMEIYRSGNFKLRFSPAMNEYLKVHQRDFMPEDTKAGQIIEYLEKCSDNMVCSKQLFREALGHSFDEPKQWKIREINDIMNNSVTGWRAFSNPRYFRSPYGRQKGWERIQPNNGGGDFQELTPEEVEQLELPPEWLK